MYASCNFETSDGNEANQQNTHNHIKQYVLKWMEIIENDRHYYISNILTSNNSSSFTIRSYYHTVVYDT